MDHSTESVPLSERRSLWSVSTVLAGVPLCASGLFVGAALVKNLTFADAIVCSVIGSLIVMLYAGVVGGIGAKTGQSTSLLLQECFGSVGAALVALSLAVCLAGWYAVQVGYFGQTISALFPEGGVLTSPKVAAAWGGILMLSTAYFGYRGLSFLSAVAVPLIVALSAWGVWSATASTDIWAVKPSEPGTFGSAITMIVGSFAVGATVNADVTRYAKSQSHAWVATIAGFFIASLYIFLAGAATAIATGSASGDLISAMVALGLGTPALIVLVLGQWTTNDNNLYWASVNAAGAFPRVSKSTIVLVFGLLATTAGVLGLADSFIPFLIALGVLIPPVGGVLIGHHLVTRKHTGRFGGKFAWSAAGAWIAGSLVGFTFEFWIPALNSAFVALLLYIGAEMLRVRKPKVPLSRQATDAL